MKMVKKVLAATTAIGLATAASGAEMTMKFGHVGAPGSLFEASVDNFAECVNSSMGDAVEVQTFGSSQLGNDKEMLQKLKLGQIDFSLPSSIMSSVDDSFGIFEMPYIITSRDHMRRVQDEMMDEFQAAANDNGYHIVGLAENILQRLLEFRDGFVEIPAQPFKFAHKWFVQRDTDIAL